MIGIPVGGVRVETNRQYPEELARYVRTEFGDESPAVRRHIARANAAVGEPIMPWLIKVVEKERVQPLMVVATTDYTKQENEDRLQAENDRARLEAAKLLGGFDSPKAKKVLARYAKDPVIGAEARRALSGNSGKEG